MGRIDKQKARIVERIDSMDKEIREALTKKKSNQKEINISQKMNEVTELRKMLASL